MEIDKIANAPVYARKNTEKTLFGAYKLAPQWQPFLNEIQSDAAKKCLGNMDGDFFLKLIQDLRELNEGEVSLLKILNSAADRITDKPKLNKVAAEQYDEFVNKLMKTIQNPADIEVKISEPYLGKTRTEKVKGEIYPANVTDSFVDLTIPETDFKCSLKLGTDKRFFSSDNEKDNFYFARKLWNNLEDDKKSPYKRMFDDFSEALINGFVDLYENMAKSVNKGSGKVPPFVSIPFN